MTASIKKITAGDGYTYLSEQTAAADIQRGSQSLAEYYTEKGEAPGRWMGAGLAGLEFSAELKTVIDAHDPQMTGFYLKHGVPVDQDTEGFVNSARAGLVVTEDQMLALFGEGRHPDADLIEAAMVAKTGSTKRALAASKLGASYRQVRSDDMTDYQLLVVELMDKYTEANGLMKRDKPPAEVISQIKTHAAITTFKEEYGRDPDEREINGWIARQSRPRAMPCAGYDLTFTPSKSVSVLWGLADMSTAARIHQIHQQAVEQSLAWFEDNLLFTRQGHGGVRQVKTRGVIAAAFDHRTSRAGDPNLHTHVAISNKVQTLDDGKWLSIDGRDIYQGMVALSEHYNTTIQSLLTQELGVTWEARSPGIGKQPIWEIAEISPELINMFSKRRANIETRQGVLEAEFRNRHGRFPTPDEARRLAQQATIETRPAKVDPRTPNDERANWRAQSTSLLGAATVDQIIVAALSHTPVEAPRLDQLDRDALAVRVLTNVTNRQATFNDTHIIAEVHRVLRFETPNVDPDLVNDITHRALGFAVSLARPDLAATPTEVTIDGRSAYPRIHGELWTTRETLNAEQRIVAMAGQTDGFRVRDTDVAVAMLCAGVTLNSDQANLVTAMATSGRRVQLALAPAGTGKTTAMKVLDEAWRAGGGSLVGLSHQATAADELRDTLADSAPCDTIAKLTDWLTRSADHPELKPPTWFNAVDERTLIIIDEAGMASTRDLDLAIGFAVSRGASVRLIGDDQQLASIGAGGVLRDIDATYGSVTLNELMRFRDPVEGHTTLALREGRHDALGWYLDHQRIQPVTDTTGAHQVLHDWSIDILEGRQSMMMAARLDHVRQMNLGAQQWYRQAGWASTTQLINLADGTTAGVGDLITTRRNARWMRVSETDFVKNRDRWVVSQVHTDGAISATRIDNRGDRTYTAYLPADYVSEFVELGYATTITGAQGRTVDISRTLYTGDETRNLAYVATTRGREANHLYVMVGGDSDTHAGPFDQADRLKTATDILETILDNSGVEQSATTVLASHTDPFLRLHQDHDIYLDAVGLAAKSVLGDDGVTALTTLADRYMADRQYERGLSGEPSWDALLTKLCILTVNGNDPRHILATALDQDFLDERARHKNQAHDYAAVLHRRLPDLPTGPLPWLPAIPQPFTSRLASTEQWQPWHTYLTAYELTIRTEAQQIRETARAWTPQTCPSWARPLLETDQTLIEDLAVWRCANGIPDNDTRPAGPATTITVRHQQHWRLLTSRVTDHINLRSWNGSVPEVAKNDPLWPVIATRMSQAVSTGRFTDQEMLAAILTQVEDRPPLPDDHPAAALWARIQYELPPEEETIAGQTRQVLHPEWADNLRNALPGPVQATMYTSPDWPPLAALISSIPEADRQHLVSMAIGITTAHTQIPTEGHLNVLTHTLADLVDLDRQTRQDASNPYAHESKEPPPDPFDDVISADDREWLDHIRSQYTEVATANLETTSPLADSATDDMSTPRDKVLARDRELAHERDHDHLYTDTKAHEADLLDIPPEDTQETRTSRSRILELNNLAAQWWHDQYIESGAAAYMRDRFGTDLADDHRFVIGRAPAGWTPLIDHLTSQGTVTVEELIDAGLAKYNRAGKPMDVFRDRIMVGIINRDGDLVGFQGRARPGTESDKTPKYVNTPTTEVYHKGEVLFGENNLTQDSVPVVTEGPMDAIAATLAGDGQAVGVAACGTGFTASHASIVAQSTSQKHVIVATDTDPAGNAAAAKANQLLLPLGTDTRRLSILGKDPADMWKTNPELLKQQLAHPDYLSILTLQVLTDTVDKTIASDNPETIGTIDDQDPRMIVTPWIVETLSQLPQEQIPAVLGALLDHMNGGYWAHDIEQAIHQRIGDIAQHAVNTGTTVRSTFQNPNLVQPNPQGFHPRDNELEQYLD